MRELVPFAGDNVLAGFYYHFGGHANPHRTLQAYAWALQNLGGRILEHTPVVAIERHTMTRPMTLAQAVMAVAQGT